MTKETKQEEKYFFYNPRGDQKGVPETTPKRKKQPEPFEPIQPSKPKEVPVKPEPKTVPQKEVPAEWN